METIRPLLQQGNRKLGESIFHFDLEAVKTCPGATEICKKHCYARRHRFMFHAVRERLAWNYKQTQRADFCDRMVEEIRRKGVLVLRVHVSGDLFSADYAKKWLSIMKRCPKVRFYLYTRSHRIPEIAAVLEEMAALRCARIWYSLDQQTGLPERIPTGVRLCYMQVDAEEQAEQVDLVFRVHHLRKSRIALSLVCPNEHPNGRKEGVTCGRCMRCFE